MSSYEQLVGEALLDDNREQSMRRITCKTVASTQMFCGCGDVLDQRTVCVLETQDGKKTYAACCPACRTTQSAQISAMASKHNLQLVWLNWDSAAIVNEQ
jgi:NAD(P)H-hydrate repair Nnr-like enzyme with NAD(P)H-hydrate dehydratase domain